jgi:hypothetical protein
MVVVVVVVAAAGIPVLNSVEHAATCKEKAGGGNLNYGAYLFQVATYSENGIESHRSSWLP